MKLSLTAIVKSPFKFLHLYLFVFLTIFLVSVSESDADRTSPADAAQAVRGWLKMDPKPLDASLGDKITNIQTFVDEQQLPIYYVVYLRRNGFVILPADDMVEPIIAFVEKGVYHPTDERPLGALVTRDIPTRVSAMRKLQQARKEGKEPDFQVDRTEALEKNSRRAKAKWSELKMTASASDIEPAGLSGISEVWVAPLTQSTWGQANVEGYSNTPACYNYYTPPGPDGSSDNYPCGCVATSMVQVMRYHEYAVGGYVWADMPLQPEVGVITLSQRQAIGDFCYDAAESVNTTYGSGGSSATLYDASEQLRNTFGYSNSIFIYDPGGIMSYLDDIVNPNLDAAHPVILGIDGPYGGHAVVCDGYGYNSSTMYHHLNMGWDGRENAWYNLPDVDSSPYYFDSVLDCVYNIFITGAGEIISGRVIDDSSGDPLSGVTVTAEGSGGPYTDQTDGNGIYALAKVPSSTTFTVSAGKTGWDFSSSQQVTTGTSSDYPPTSAAGNRWGIDFTGTISAPSPPTAEPNTVSVEQGVAETIELQASDDGAPNPPGQLTYIITSLPNHGEVHDPGAGVISEADLPYTLIANGNQVEYSSCYYYTGSDSFDFKANDGGTPPEGGDSNTATVTIQVEAPGQTVIYETNFDSGLPSGWTIVDGFSDGYTWTTENDYLEQVPEWSGTTYMVVGYEYEQNDMDEQLITQSIDCLGLQNVTLSFRHEFEHYSTEIGDVDVRVNAGSWQNVARYDTTGEYTLSGIEELDISAIADNQPDVQVRWYYYNADWEWYWGIDDVQVTGEYAPQEPVAGDFQLDCDVDFPDFAILAEAWMSTPVDDNWNSDCDISDPPDDSIDEYDLDVFTQSWLTEIAP